MRARAIRSGPPISGIQRVSSLAIAGSDSGERSSRRQRLRMVGSSRSGAAVTSSCTVRGGGSSSVFSRMFGTTSRSARSELVDHHHAPAALRRGHRHEAHGRPRILGPQYLLLALVARVRRHGEEVGMGGGSDSAEDRMAFRQEQRRLAGRARRHPGQQPAGEAEGQRRLADAGRPGDQPGMMHPARERGFLQRPGRIVMADEVGGRPRLAHRSARTARRIAAATPSGPSVASTSTQRPGSAAAIARKPARTRAWKSASIAS